MELGTTAKTGNADQPRNSLGEFVSEVETAVDGAAAEEAGVLSEEEAAEFDEADKGLTDTHDEISDIHAKIAEHMAKLKELHSKLGKTLDKGDAQLEKMNTLDEKVRGADEAPLESKVLDVGREQHEHLGEALDNHKDDAKKMRAAQKHHEVD